MGGKPPSLNRRYVNSCAHANKLPLTLPLVCLNVQVAGKRYKPVGASYCLWPQNELSVKTTERA